MQSKKFMNKKNSILTFIFLAFTAVNTFSQTAHVSENYCDYKKIDLTKIVSVTPENASAIRDKLSDIVFGSISLPNGLPDTIFKIQDTLYDHISNLENIELFKVIQPYNIQSIGYIFHPKTNNGRLFIYHQGHNGDFIVGKSVIEYFVNKGFTVYAFCMPLFGKNNDPVVTVDKIGTFKLTDEEMESHELMKFLDNPISYFSAPVIVMINYAQTKNFNDISMCGISGGGWTTTLVSALDTRINYSFPVAGSYPMYIKLNSPSKSYGDFEQLYPPLYKNVNYLDMYILGASGKNRFQVQLLNLHDPCCFDGTYFEHYEAYVKKVVNGFEHGSFRVVLDTVNPEHRVSEFLMKKIDEALTQSQEK